MPPLEALHEKIRALPSLQKLDNDQKNPKSRVQEVSRDQRMISLIALKHIKTISKNGLQKCNVNLIHPEFWGEFFDVNFWR